jgi:hypothetical protein
VQHEAGVRDEGNSGEATATTGQPTTEQQPTWQPTSEQSTTAQPSTGQPTTGQPSSEQPTTQVAHTGDAPVQTDQASTLRRTTEPSAGSRGAHAIGHADSSGRGSQEPGSPSDELDMDRSWNPFKRPQ